MILRTGCLGVALVLWLVAGAAQAQTTRTWDGGGGDDLASTALNWSGDALPTSSDDIVLDGTTNKNMTWDAGVNGLPDTVASWTQTADHTGTVTIDTRYSGQGSFTNFTITGDLTISNGVWRHGDNSVYDDETERFRLYVKVNGNFTLGAAATVNVDSRGYRQRRGPGKGVDWKVAASHGGQGGKSANNNGAEGFSYNNLPFASMYGSIREPTRLGSGSGSGSGGGGAVRIEVTGATQLDGTISACGVSPSASAGGSVWLRTGALSGAGIINVSGGKNSGWGVTGAGGGRIAVVVTNAPTAGNVDCRAFGGVVSDIGGNGAAGTIYIETTAHTPGQGRLIVNNNNSGIGNIPSTVLLESPAGFAQVIVTNTGAIALNGIAYDFATSTNIEGGGEVRVQNATGVTFPNPFVIGQRFRLGLDVPIAAAGDWTIATNGVLTHGSVAYVCRVNTASPTPDPATKVSLTLQGDLTVANGGRIDVDAKGHGPARGPGRGKDAHRTAASHGGQGGTYSGYTPSTTYGTLRDPYRHGSGPGDIVGFGGGVIKLDVSGLTTVESGAVLTAKGTVNSSSGGSIWLRTGTLGGSGTVDASGSTRSGARSTGGGGRIAVIVTNAASIGGLVCRAFGGPGAMDTDKQGAAGTVFVQTTNDVANGGAVSVNNNSQVATIALTPLPPFTGSSESMTTTRWTAQNRAKIGLAANTTAAGLTLNANSYLELAGRTGTVSTLTITNVSFGAGVYTAGQLGTLVSDSSGGQGRVVVVPPGVYVDDTGVVEGGSGATADASFRIRFENVTTTVTLDYYTTNDTAGAGSDYTATNGSLTVAAGVAQTQVVVRVTGDDWIEPDETFRLIVTNVVGATAMDAEGACTITNDDARTISIAAAVVVDPEGPLGTDTSAVFTVTLSGPAIGTDVTFQYDTEDGTATAASGDYTAVSGGSGTIKAGTTVTNIAITVKGDDTPEGISENFRVVLSNPSANATLGTTTTGTCTIVDDDGLPTLSVADATVTEGNTGSVNANFVVSINKPDPGSAVTFDYETVDETATAASGDYTAASGSGSIPAGALQTTVTVAVAGDYLPEADETFGLRLYNISANAEGFDTNAVGTILNDDYPFVWTGAGTNSQASNTNNWRWNGVTATRLPAATDVVLLDGTSRSNLTWDAGVNGLTDTVAEWQQMGTYSGTVTMLTLYPGRGAFTNFTIVRDGVVSNGVWTHGNNASYGSGNVEHYRLCVAVGGNFTLGAAATINADVRGYTQDQGDGKGVNWKVAASHGGQGGKSSINAEGFSYNALPFAATYGAIREPTRLGSGAGSGGTGGAGGGAVRIEVTGNALLDGTISARGATANASAGGSVWLQAAVLSGAGVVDVSGGKNPSWGGGTGAGGGRIAVIVTNAPTAGNVVCRAFGAVVSNIGNNGAAGTVYIETTAHTPGAGRLIVNNNSGIGNIPSTVLLESPAGFAQLIVTNTAAIALNGIAYDFATSGNIEGGGEVRVQNAAGVTFPDPFVIGQRFRLGLDVPIAATGDWTIATNGVLTHGSVAYVANAEGAYPAYAGDPATKLFLTLTGNLTVANGGRIDVDGKGHGMARGIGRGKDAHQTAASHGGQGGTYSGLTPVGTYGSVREPFWHGSGAGDIAGFGGGVIKLDVSGLTTVESGAVLTAKGTVSSSSGGSIWLRTGTLGGSGTVDASGATRTSARSTGGGGRIAVIVTGAPTIGGVVCQAFGGPGPMDNNTMGAAGTVYTETQGVASGSGRIVADNNNLVTTIALTDIEAPTEAAPALVKLSGLDILRRARVRLRSSRYGGELNVAANAQLDLNGCELKVRSLTVAGLSYKAGVYAAADLGAEVVDSDPGLAGRVVMPATGTLFAIR